MFFEEAVILAPFREKAEKGEIIEVKEIEAAYQAAVDHPISAAQIYYVLHRHGWRKVMPRVVIGYASEEDPQQLWRFCMGKENA